MRGTVKSKDFNQKTLNKESEMNKFFECIEMIDENLETFILGAAAVAGMAIIVLSAAGIDIPLMFS